MHPNSMLCYPPSWQTHTPFCHPRPVTCSWPKVDKRCWTDFDDYTCFDASHYCLASPAVLFALNFILS